MRQDSASGAAALRPESFPILPDRAARAVTHALVMELLALHHEEGESWRRFLQVAAAGAPDRKQSAALQTFRQLQQDADAIRDFLERAFPTFASEFPKKIQPRKPLTPEERAQLRALGKPGKEAAQ